VTDHSDPTLTGWKFCDNSWCLFCATRSPRRSVSAEPPKSSAVAGEDAPESVAFRLSDASPGVLRRAFAGEDVSGPRPLFALPDRDSQVARIADAFGVPLGMVDDRVVVERPRRRRRLRVYFEPRDVWVGVYVAEDAVYVCPLPCVVIRWQR
jgi:hypothetical protein